MTERQKACGTPAKIHVSTRLIGCSEEGKTPDTYAYAFTQGGALLDFVQIERKGAGTLTVDIGRGATAVRVMVGPMDEERTVASLLRLGAQERHLRVEESRADLEVAFDVLPERWRVWLGIRCCVPGTVLKRVTSGGIPIHLPICNATVEIYEVDPLWIILPRIPDLVIDRWREILIDPPRVWPPIDPRLPIPPIPDPEPDPWPIARGRAVVAEPVLRQQAAAVSGAIPIPESLRLAAATASVDSLRLELALHPSIIVPLVCLYYPHLVTMSKICETKTDDCGHFQCCFWRSFANPDTPDLYFRVRQRLFGLFDVTIYEPKPVACWTRWNYVCGTEVTLHVTHPLAITCAPCPPVDAPNDWVLVMAIGNLSLADIHGTSIDLAGSTNATNRGLTRSGAPFGGLLRPRLEFDNSLRDDLGVQYYRVSWRLGTSGQFSPLNGSVNRHFTHEIGGDLVLENYPLGPNVIGTQANLFEIPPALPPVGQWSLPDVVEDTASAYFPTAGLVPAAAAGKVQLQIELFDTSGNPINPSALGIKFRVPRVSTFDGTIYTDDAADPALGLVSGNSFIMTLHVDNNVCSASLPAPSIGAQTASDNCGVLRYSESSVQTVSMPFAAAHPNGFATFRFSVFRGVNLLTPPSTTGLVPGATVTTTATTTDLLGACSVAGFSEVLNVDATATNGWSRQSQYDADAVRAFVLAPEEA